MTKYLHQDLTEKIIGCFYEVYNQLGYGFLERVYERSMVIELSRCGLEVRTQVPIKVQYKGEQVGDYYADIIVNDLVIVELKAAEVAAEEHEFQLINYLKATEIEIGLLLNFGKQPVVRRKIFTNDRKRTDTPG
ncbi:MAG: GxxExxY protein [Bacteroidetes bacterium]|nr:GxxExxY protein [Bacteroidota bacterium]MCW5895900.1 GxxExxY protein [Bacteroidota bacterium]